MSLVKPGPLRLPTCRTLPAKGLESVMEGARLLNCMFEAYYQMIFCNKEGKCNNGIVSKHATLSIHQDSVERIRMKLSGVELAWNEKAKVLFRH